MTRDIDLAWTGERFLPGIEGDIALEHFHRYALAKTLAPSKRVLDVACGEGYGAALLAEVASSVIGVDIDPPTIAHASATYRRSNLRFQQGACTHLDLPDSSIELATCFETLEHHSEHDAMMAELRRVLVPDGILIVSTPDRRHYSDELNYVNPFHIRELYAEEFVQLVRQHFQHALFFGQRIAYGSLLAPIGNVGEFISFSRKQGEILVQSGLAAPLYILAVASAKPIPSVPSSLLDETRAHAIQVNQLRQDLQVTRDLLASIHASAYWRIAEPVRWLRKVLRRIRGH